MKKYCTCGKPNRKIVQVKRAQGGQKKITKEKKIQLSTSQKKIPQKKILKTKTTTQRGEPNVVPNLSQSTPELVFEPKVVKKSIKVEEEVPHVDESVKTNSEKAMGFRGMKDHSGIPDANKLLVGPEKESPLIYGLQGKKGFSYLPRKKGVYSSSIEKLKMKRDERMKESKRI